MFDKLKKKLSQVKERIVGKIVSKSEEVEPEIPEKLQEVEVEPEVTRPEPVPEPVKAPPAPKVAEPQRATVPSKPGVVPPLKIEKKPSKVPEPAPTKAPERVPAKVLAIERPKKGLRRAVKQILGRTLSASDVEDIIWDLQVTLLESDVAVPVADHVIERVKAGLVGKKIGVRDDPSKLADEVLRQAIREVLEPKQKVDLLGVIKAKRAKGELAVIVFVGINGHGKTTTIAKMSRYLMGHGYKVVMAAADTFRAAAIEQLEIHAQRLGVDVVKQRRGADAAAVAYDAVAHAKAKGADVVLVDTAGRMQTDVNLMDEMKKIVRVAKPDLILFVGDALTGNDAVEQARAFDQAVGISGSILCKMDADARGGAALSISQITGKPILFIGTGQGYEDMVEFKPDIILNALFGD
jgi:fused signal recognition particle receptor